MKTLSGHRKNSMRHNESALWVFYTVYGDYIPCIWHYAFWE